MSLKELATEILYLSAEIPETTEKSALEQAKEVFRDTLAVWYLQAHYQACCALREQRRSRAMRRVSR